MSYANTSPPLAPQSSVVPYQAFLFIFTCLSRTNMEKNSLNLLFIPAFLISNIPYRNLTGFPLFQVNTSYQKVCTCSSDLVQWTKLCCDPTPDWGLKTRSVYCSSTSTLCTVRG